MSKLTTKQRILQEAEKQFIDSGIANTQMKDIALAVNINRRTLYRYFPTKDELAFEVEIIVMKQIQDYLTLDIGDISEKTGFEKIETYFNHVNFDEIREQMKFTAEFDRYFQNDYPSPELEQALVEVLDPRKDQLYQYICEGVQDGTLRNDMKADNLYHFISHSFIALFQRLLLRENHLKYEYCNDVDFQKLFRDIILSGIKPQK